MCATITLRKGTASRHVLSVTGPVKRESDAASAARNSYTVVPFGSPPDDSGSVSGLSTSHGRSEAITKCRLDLKETVRYYIYEQPFIYHDADDDTANYRWTQDARRA
jgi:hypothetical protein